MDKQYKWWLDNVHDKFEEFSKWLGDEDNVSRVWFRDFVKENKIESVLDVACGPCIDYDGLVNNGIQVRYRGHDITPFQVNIAKHRGIDCKVSNIESIRELDDSYELVYARHIIEHLEYYKKAVSEMCRVASKYVLIVHFIPMGSKDVIKKTELDSGKFHENSYGEQDFIKYCEQFGQVQRIDLNDLKMRQTITLIELK